MVIEVKAVALPNKNVSIAVSWLSGLKVIEPREVARKKASDPIEVTLAGMFTEVSAEVAAKAPKPIEVTLFGIVTEVSAVALRKAS